MKSKTSRIIVIIAVIAVIAAVFIGAVINRDSGDDGAETTKHGMYVADTDGSTYWTELAPEEEYTGTGAVTWPAMTK